MLLKRPRLLETLDDAERKAILARGEQDLLGEVANYLAEHPEADAAQILGRWSGDAWHPQLAALYERPTMLNDEQTAAEFKDAAGRLVKSAHRRERQQLLDKLREDPSSREIGARLWSLQKDAHLRNDAKHPQ